MGLDRGDGAREAESDDDDIEFFRHPVFLVRGARIWIRGANCGKSQQTEIVVWYGRNSGKRLEWAAALDPDSQSPGLSS
jgi:hypothetical protein